MTFLARRRVLGLKYNVQVEGSCGTDTPVRLPLTLTFVLMISFLAARVIFDRLRSESTSRATDESVRPTLPASSKIEALR